MQKYLIIKTGKKPVAHFRDADGNLMMYKCPSEDDTFAFISRTIEELVRHVPLATLYGTPVRVSCPDGPDTISEHSRGLLSSMSKNNVMYTVMDIPIVPDMDLYTANFFYFYEKGN